MLARPKSRKEPVTADMLKEMVEAAGPDPSLTDVRLLAMCLVAFAGFLRCDELIKLRCSDIVFNTESMVITIVGSKTDQYREGSSLIVARTSTVTCPVGMMERYFAMGGLECTAHEHVFRAISKTKLGKKLRKGGGLSYSRARELLLEKIKSMGMDPALFGMHSLRAGGATAAANAGVPIVQETWSMEIRVSKGWVCERFSGQSFGGIKETWPLTRLSLLLYVGCRAQATLHQCVVK